VRMWEYYLAICEASFLERNTGNVQLLLVKTGARRRLYGEPADVAEAAAGASGAAGAAFSRVGRRTEASRRA